MITKSPLSVVRYILQVRLMSSLLSRCCLVTYLLLQDATHVILSSSWLSSPAIHRWTVSRRHTSRWPPRRMDVLSLVIFHDITGCGLPSAVHVSMLSSNDTFVIYGPSEWSRISISQYKRSSYAKIKNQLGAAPQSGFLHNYVGHQLKRCSMRL